MVCHKTETQILLKFFYLVRCPYRGLCLKTLFLTVRVSGSRFLIVGRSVGGSYFTFPVIKLEVTYYLRNCVGQNFLLTYTLNDLYDRCSVILFNRVNIKNDKKKQSNGIKTSGYFDNKGFAHDDLDLYQRFVHFNRLYTD